MAARRVVAFPSEFNGLIRPNLTYPPIEPKAKNPLPSNGSSTISAVAENENPGALAGATGADFEKTSENLPCEDTAPAWARHPIISLHWGIAP